MQDRLAVRLELDDLVVACVDDEQRVVITTGAVGRQCDGLRREPEDGRLWRRRNVWAVAAMQRAALLVLGQQHADHLGEAAHLTLARRLRHHVPLWVDEDERRPGAHCVLLPELQAGIVQHRVMHLVPLDRGPQRNRLRLVRELRRVDADDGEHVAELVLERT